MPCHALRGLVLQHGQSITHHNDVQGISKAWKGKKFINSFSYEFSPGERLGIVGPNGAGKSTLLDMLAGVLPIDEGQRILGDTSVVGYFAQHPPPVNPKLRVIDYITSVVDNACALALQMFVIFVPLPAARFKGMVQYGSGSLH